MKLADFEVGLDRPFFLISGPCVIESEALCEEVAGRLLEVTLTGFADQIASAASLLLGEANEGTPLVLHHTRCHHDMAAAVVCDQCGERIEVKEVRARRGPGHPLHDGAASSPRGELEGPPPR